MVKRAKDRHRVTIIASLAVMLALDIYCHRDCKCLVRRVFMVYRASVYFLYRRKSALDCGGTMKICRSAPKGRRHLRHKRFPPNG